MMRFINLPSKKPGLSPGTMVHVGEKKTGEVKLHLIDYKQDDLRETQLQNADEAASMKDSETMSWLDVTGLHDTGIISRLGEIFSLHPLILEDIVHTGQRPKIEEYDGILFLVIKMLDYDPEQGITAEQVSVVSGENFLLSFQEMEGDVFNSVRARIRKGNLRIRKMGSPYLCYALTDAVVDHYFLVLEKMGEKIEELEDELIVNPTDETMQGIHQLRGDLIALRRSVWPLREVVNEISRGDSILIPSETGVFFRDVYDHTIQVMDTIETYREMVSGMFDMYQSSIGNRMNEVMKVLTIIATIFIPITFIAGIYGMNFAFMPELQWRWGYPAAWGLMLAVIAVMVVYFKKKKWW